MPKESAAGCADSLPGPGNPRDEGVMPPRLPREEIEQRCKHRHLLSSEPEQHRLRAGQIEQGSRVYECVPGKYSARIGSMDPVRTEHC